MKFSIKDVFSNWSHLRKKSLIEKIIFCAVEAQISMIVFIKGISLFYNLFVFIITGIRPFVTFVLSRCSSISVSIFIYLINLY